MKRLIEWLRLKFEAQKPKSPVAMPSVKDRRLDEFKYRNIFDHTSNR